MGQGWGRGEGRDPDKVFGRGQHAGVGVWLGLVSRAGIGAVMGGHWGRPRIIVLESLPSIVGVRVALSEPLSMSSSVSPS